MGNSLSLTCGAETDSALQADPEYSWVLPDGSTQMGKTLSFNTVGFDLNGPFMCIVDNEFSLPKTAQVNVSVMGPLLIEIDPENPIGKLNHTLNITCFTNTTGASFVWKNGSEEVDYRDGKAVVSYSSDGISSVLSIRKFNKFDIATYSCEIFSDIHVMVKKNFSVSLSDEIYLLWEDNNPVGISRNTFILICPVAGGKGKLSDPTWYRNDTPILPGDNGIFVSMNEANHSLLSISSLDLIHEYDTFTCAVTDDSGSEFRKHFRIVVESESHVLYISLFVFHRFVQLSLFVVVV